MSGRNFEQVREAVMAELRDHFRPEFWNRVDEMIVFKSLAQDQPIKIVDIQLKRLESRLGDPRVRLVVTDAAREAASRPRLGPGLRGLGR